MSETPTTADATEATGTQGPPAEGTTPDDAATRQGAEQNDASEDASDQPDVGKEAAKYRRQLRATEKVLASTQSQLSELRKQVAEQQAAADLPKPSALWLNGRAVDSLYGEDGRLDPQAFQAAVAEVHELVGISCEPDMGQGRRNSYRSTGNAVADAMMKRGKR